MGLPINSNTMIYGITKAPPPLANAINGKRHTLPKPTDKAMQENKNSISLPHFSRLVFELLSVVELVAESFFKKFIL